MLERIVKQHHVFIWAGTWTTVMVMGWGAIAILLNPNLGQPSASMTQFPDKAGSGVPAVETPQRSLPQRSLPPSPSRPTHHSNDAAIAFWSLGLVALTCCGGSIILSQHLKPRARR
ncbi:MAG: hypothetical protein AB4042_08880 [Leptolyngbyaceae cyanobacterium]